jgi:hypothetical protein
MMAGTFEALLRRRLSPLQRAYWMGYRRAKVQMQRELDAMARRQDDKLAKFTDEMWAARQQVIQHINDELAGLADEMQGMRDDYRRLRAIEHAVDTERDPNTLLN